MPNHTGAALTVPWIAAVRQEHAAERYVRSVRTRFEQHATTTIDVDQPPPADTSPSPSSVPGATTSAEPGPVLAWLDIPSIGVSIPVETGTADELLDRGVAGWYPQTGTVDQAARRIVLTAHRTGAGGPFHDLDQLATGDELTLTLPSGTVHRLVVAGPWTVVTPADPTVLGDTTPGLLLVTWIAVRMIWEGGHEVMNAM